jgi:hypothetical protein
MIGIYRRGEWKNTIHNEVQLCHLPEHCMCHDNRKPLLVMNSVSQCKEYFGMGSSKQCRMAFCKL